MPDYSYVIEPPKPVESEQTGAVFGHTPDENF